jgi:ABC-type transporter Mla MlaB component
MTLKIQRFAAGEEIMFRLSGRIEPEQLSELQRIFKAEPEGQSIVIDLTDLKLVDRGALKFLVICEAEGMKLENCPGYIREWIMREKR